MKQTKNITRDLFSKCRSQIRSIYQAAWFQPCVCVCVYQVTERLLLFSVNRYINSVYSIQFIGKKFILNGLWWNIYSLPVNGKLRTRFETVLHCALITMTIILQRAYAGKMTDYRMESYATVLCIVFTHLLNQSFHFPPRACVNTLWNLLRSILF